MTKIQIPSRRTLTELTLTEWFRSDISRMDIDRIIIILNGADIDRIFIDRFRIWPNYFIPVQNSTEYRYNNWFIEWVRWFVILQVSATLISTVLSPYGAIMAAAAPKVERIFSVKHNRTVLYHEGYSYHYNQRSAKDKTSYYRCKLREFSGTGKIVDGKEFQTMRIHSLHPVI